LFCEKVAPFARLTRSVCRNAIESMKAKIEFVNLRDLRRYSVTINNPQQVNIASDGGQQVNVGGSVERPAGTR
jgi:hypothetical protein